MTLQTGLIITGDADSAKAAVNALTRETQQLSGATTQAGAAAGAAASSVDRLTSAELRQLNAISDLAAAFGRLDAAQARHNASQRQGAVSDGQRRAGMQQLSMQIGDVSQQLALGVNPAVVFGQQFGQIVQAIQLTRGAAGGFVGFLAGPWGAVLTGAITVAGLFAASLFESADATDTQAAAARNSLTATDALSRAQSVLGQIFDLTTGQIRNNTEALRANAIAQAIALRVQAQGQIGSTRLAEQMLQTGAARFDAMSPAALAAARAVNPQAFQQLTNLRQIAINAGMIGGRRTATIDRAEAMRLIGAADTSQLPSHLQAGNLVRILNDRVQGEASLRIADDTLESLRPGGSLASSLRRPGGAGGGRTRRSNAGAASRLNEFGSDAATRISELVGQFTDAPAQVGRVTRALADLDDLMEDVEERRPPNFQQLLEQGRAARQVIQDGINRPYQEFIASQEEGLRIARLESQGRTDEAEALRAILQLEQQSGALSQERRDTILAGVQATRELQRETEILQERQQTYLNTLGEFRGALREAIVGPLQGDFGALARLPQRLLNASAELIGRQIEERIFGDAFRRIEDRINGNDVARDAAERFRDGATEARDASRDAAQALQDLARASRSASGAVAGGGGWWRGVETPALFNDDVPFSWPAGGMPGEGEDGPITVTGARSRSSWPSDPRQFFRSAAESILTPILGERFAGFVSKGVSSALQGAAYGQIGGGIVSMFGGRSSQTASAIGGALGNIAGEALSGTLKEVFGSVGGQLGGPIGSIIGSIAGNLLGGLLRKSKTGSATITSIDGAATTSGNNAQFRSQASGLAGGVQEALGQIAEQLGGGVGSFAVSIGIRDGKLRVDPTGRGATKTKKGAVDFGEDEAGAIAFAIADAIADGAITGLSQAVQAALRSSPDVNKALREALKVDELETLLAGTAGALNKTFKDFERQAAERLRLAQKYGFDLVKLEELNAKERAALFDQVMKDRIGSLQTLLDDLAFGDLFEGSIADQRQKLLVEIAKAEADATAGTDGAADRVAELRRKLLEISREGFGTAGPEFAADRAGTIASAQEIIRLETERAKEARDAQAATNDHLATANRLADENNDQNAEILAALRVVGSLLGGGASRESGPTTGRTVDL